MPKLKSLQIAACAAISFKYFAVPSLALITSSDGIGKRLRKGSKGVAIHTPPCPK